MGQKIWHSIFNDLPNEGARQLPQGDRNTNLATANLSHTIIGLTSMIMNCTNQETVIQLLDDNTYSSHCETSD